MLAGSTLIMIPRFNETAVLAAIAEHGATTDFSSPLTAARTNLGPALVRWLVFPHNVNYHVEHHLYASVPQYHLPELHREMAAAVKPRTA